MELMSIKNLQFHYNMDVSEFKKISDDRYVFNTNKPLHKVLNAIPFAAHTIVDTELWGFLKNENNMKLTEELKTDILMNILSN